MVHARAGLFALYLADSARHVARTGTKSCGVWDWRSDKLSMVACFGSSEALPDTGIGRVRHDSVLAYAVQFIGYHIAELPVNRVGYVAEISSNNTRRG